MGNPVCKQEEIYIDSILVIALGKEEYLFNFSYYSRKGSILIQLQLLFSERKHIDSISVIILGKEEY